MKRAVTCPSPQCRSPRSRVYKTVRHEDEELTDRHRLCLVCGREWVTRAHESPETFFRNKPALRKKRDSMTVGAK